MSEKDRADEMERTKRMFGMTLAEVEAYLAPQAKLTGWRMLAMAMLSDTQELMLRGQHEEARQLINRVKWILGSRTDLVPKQER